DADGPADGTHFRPEVLHLSNRHAVVAGNHHNARAFEDLAEFLDHFLFLGSIHGFTPSVGVSPRLKFAPDGIGGSGPDGPEARIARGQAPDSPVSFPISGRIYGVTSTLRLGQDGAFPPRHSPGKVARQISCAQCAVADVRST